MLSQGSPDREVLMYKIQKPVLSSFFYHARNSPWTWEEVSQALIFRSSVYEQTAPTDFVRKDSYKYYQTLFREKVPSEPQNMMVTVKEENEPYIRTNATLLSIITNDDLEPLLATLSDVEKLWNKNYHYPYVFLSPDSLTEDFQSRVKQICSGEVFFEQIPESVWSTPSNIDPAKQKQGVEKLNLNGVRYADDLNYHHKMRFKAGYFYKAESLKNFKYYWNLEPGSQYHCEVNYDVFKFMEQNDLTYGFAISLYDNPYTIETLWPTALEFVQKHPNYISQNASFNWLTESIQNPAYTEIAHGYSTCHFWSAFEIGNMDFFRSKAYNQFFQHLDSAGGFYYERWGEAPVHSIALGLFTDKNKLWWFRDIGFSQSPYHHRPLNDKCHYSRDPPGYFAEKSVRNQNCLQNWLRYEQSQQNREAYTVNN
ncbi:hypothetical protein OGAPHI_000232 [Ogataea philodendri]|uniref:Mannosyltransferase n=1 Tax=Ogataea philodendri TaxID=1378263 RepID=A0A9P8PHK5_9ASCO|nr:uncharacterized protein OGAPHI_000232 [Ogataea philodendri]KAH3671529.1 hypothetical protein OGAPHI_000232 [Ogataea philodendri]